MVQIEIIERGNEKLIACSCGWYDKSFDPVQAARMHNSRVHHGNYPIYDHSINKLRDQLTGRVIDG